MKIGETEITVSTAFIQVGGEATCNYQTRLYQRLENVFTNASQKYDSCLVLNVLKNSN